MELEGKRKELLALLWVFWEVWSDNIGLFDKLEREQLSGISWYFKDDKGIEIGWTDKFGFYYTWNNDRKSDGYRQSSQVMDETT